MLLEAKVHRSFEFVALRIGFKLSSGLSQLVRMLTRNVWLSDSKPDPTPTPPQWQRIEALLAHNPYAENHRLYDEVQSSKRSVCGNINWRLELQAWIHNANSAKR